MTFTYGTRLEPEVRRGRVIADTFTGCRHTRYTCAGGGDRQCTMIIQCCLAQYYECARRPCRTSWSNGSLGIPPTATAPSVRVTQQVLN